MEEINEELRELYEQNCGGLVNYVINKHLSTIKYFDTREDMYQSLMLKIWQNLHKYDSKRSKFSTFVVRCCEYYILLEIRKSKSKKRNAVVISSDSETTKNINLSSLIADDYNIEEELIKKEQLDYIQANIGQLSYSYYIDELTQKEIAKMHNRSQSYVARLIKKEITQLQGKIINGRSEVL